jgi:hypothetical protein
VPEPDFPFLVAAFDDGDEDPQPAKPRGRRPGCGCLPALLVLAAAAIWALAF